MRKYPDLNDKHDVKYVADLKAQPWQLDLLKKNPNYPHGGNFEDYMSEKKNGWASAVELESFSEKFELDDYNEIVNFYFEVYRKNHTCDKCEGSDLNEATKKLSDDWYDFDNTGKRWSNNISDVEVEALMKQGRISDVSGYRGYFEEDTQKWMKFENGAVIETEKPVFPTAKAVNEWSKSGFGHDAINKWICVEARAKHMGIYGHCSHCESGYVYDEPEARVALQLWVLHPRKGASRGVYIKNIEQNEVPDVITYLKTALERNTNRFSKL